MAVIQDININVHGQPSEKRLQTFLRLSQNENGRMINFRVLGPPLPSNCTATFSGTKPDGNVYSTTGTVTGNFVVVQEDIQMTAVAGVWDAKLDIVNGSHNIMTALIRVVVDADVVDPDAIASDSQLQGLVAETKYYAEHARTDAYGSPLVAALKADMTDKTRVYVYTGSESNMTAGNWYYWNGSAWTSGGVYNAVAVQTDTTLSVPGKAADGKATGDALSELREDLSVIVNDVDFNLFDRLTLEQGNISNAGIKDTSANYVSSKPIACANVEYIKMYSENAYWGKVFCLDGNGAVIHILGWFYLEFDTCVKIPNDTVYVRFSFCKDAYNPSAFAVADADYSIIAYTFGNYERYRAGNISDIDSFLKSRMTFNSNFRTPSSVESPFIIAPERPTGTLYKKRCVMSVQTVLPFDIDLNMSSDFGVKIQLYSDTTGEYGSYLSNSAEYKSAKITIPKNTAFTLMFFKVDYSAFELADLLSAISFTKAEYISIDDKFTWDQLALGNSSPSWVNNRILSDRIPVSWFDAIKISVDDGYSYGISGFSNPSGFPRILDVTGVWTTSEMIYTASELTGKGVYYIAFILRDNNNSVIGTDAKTKLHIDIIPSGNTLTLGASLYDTEYSGAKVQCKKHKMRIVEMFLADKVVADASTASMNGMAVYDGVMFQFFHGDFVNLRDMASGASIAKLTVDADHADCVQISNEFYSENDEFPLFYSSSDTNPALVKVNRITRLGSTLIRTYSFPIDKTGYYAGHCMDFETNICYQIGYKNRDYLTEANGNCMIVSAWNMKNTTEANGILTPEFMWSYELPFIYCTQGQKFFDGKIWICSSFPSLAYPNRIIALDPITRQIVTEMRSLGTVADNYEIEDLDFVYDDVTDEFYMLLSIQAQKYQRYNFS